MLLRSLLPLLIVILVAFVPCASRANVVGVDTQNFNPTTNGLDFVTVQSSETLSPGYINLGLFLNYAKNTLPVFNSQTGGGKETTDSLTSLDMSIGFGLTRFLDLGVSFPYLLNQEVHSDQFRGEFGRTGSTEVRFNTKLKLLGDRDGGLAAILSANYNRLENNPFLGKGGGTTYNAELAADTTISLISLAMNLGFRKRDPGEKLAEFPIEPFRDQYIGSVAASFLLKGLDTKLIAEIWASQPVKKVETDIERQQSSREAIFGLKYDATPTVALHVGAGREMSHSIASPELRVYTGINWVIAPAHISKMSQARIKRKKALLPPPPPAADDEPPVIVAEEQADEVFVLRDINFAFDSDLQVLQGARNELHKLAERMKEKGYQRIIIEGHTDSMGSDEYNMDLGLRRAESIKRHLMKYETLDAPKLEAISLGESQPIADNGNAQGRQLNRRVVFKIFYPK